MHGGTNATYSNTCMYSNTPAGVVMRTGMARMSNKTIYEDY